MHMGILPTCMSAFTMHVPGAHSCQKKALDPLDLELKMVMSRYIGPGIDPESPGRATYALKCGAIFPLHCLSILISLPLQEYPLGF